MKNIFYILELIQKRAQEQLDYAAKAERVFHQCDYERLVSAAEKGMSSSSKLYMEYRDLILSLYAFIPSLPHTVDVSKVDAKNIKVSVDEVKDFGFPVYRITVPFLLPNKRKSNNDFKTAITETVGDAVRRFGDENHIRPFKSATVIFLSYYDQNPMVVADNDNKESSVILNVLPGALISDDNCAACHTSYYSRRVEHGKKTEIYIVDSSHDVELLSSLKAEIIDQ